MVLKEKDIHILEIGDLENGITQILPNLVRMTFIIILDTG